MELIKRMKFQGDNRMERLCILSLHNLNALNRNFMGIICQIKSQSSCFLSKGEAEICKVQHVECTAQLHKEWESFL
jgi:hypothetical protein